MPAHAQPDALLTFTLDGVDYACQLITPSFKQPGPADSETIRTACGDTVVIPGTDITDGEIAGQVLKDTTADGLTRALAGWVAAGGSPIDYEYVENPATPEELRFTGTLTPKPFTIPFVPSSQAGRHDIVLAVNTATLAAPSTASAGA